VRSDGDGEGPGRTWEEGRVVGGVYRGEADCCNVDAIPIIELAHRDPDN